MDLPMTWISLQCAYPGVMPMPEPGPELAQRCITVQQPPRLVVEKKVIFVKKIRQDPKLINAMREICIPHVTTEVMIMRIPKLTWVTQVIKEPKVSWHEEKHAEPQVVCYPRVVVEPKEVCQAILCQPTPQVVRVPPPTEYCCYATGPTTLNCRPASRYRCPPCPPYVPPGPASPLYSPCPPCPPYCAPIPGLAAVR